MTWTEQAGSNKENRKCLGLVNQNLMQIDQGESSGVKGKNKEKWKRVKRVQKGTTGQSTEANKENLYLHSLKRGTKNVREY